MAKFKVAILNESTTLTDQEVETIAGALHHQVNHDFAPIWGSSVSTEFFAKDATIPPEYWWLVFLENSDQAGALGYHDLTNNLKPIGKVFAGTDKKYGYSPSVTASHELLEMLGDPHINLTAFDYNHNRIYAYETCDAVEADSFGYEVDGVLVSDFVTLEYFDNQAVNSGAKMSFKGHVSQPFQVAPGGYLSYLDLKNVSAGWQQVKAEGAEGARDAGFPPHSRRERRKRYYETKDLKRSTRKPH